MAKEPTPEPGLSADLHSRAGRVSALDAGVARILKRIDREGAAMSTQDLVKISAELRQYVSEGRKEEAHVAPFDREWIAEQVRRAEAAAEAISGGRPRRISAPTATEPASTKH